MSLSRDIVDQELSRYHGLALHLAELLAEGVLAPEHAGQIRAHIDALTCLLEEAPDDRQAHVEYLIDRFGALWRRVIN
jgi:hypothetical protein